MIFRTMFREIPHNILSKSHKLGACLRVKIAHKIAKTKVLVSECSRFYDRFYAIGEGIHWPTSASALDHLQTKKMSVWPKKFRRLPKVGGLNF